MKREPWSAEVEELEELYRASRFLDAHAHLAGFSEPETWASTRARIAAGRALDNLGADARARRLMLTTWRRDPASADARYFVLLDYRERHGPLETLRLFDDFARDDPRLAAPSDAADDALVWSWLLRGRCLAQCRDFEGAEPWLEAGLRARPELPWTHVERAMCLEHADRYPEALAAAERALKLRPGYARAIWTVAHLLTLAGRDDDALVLLQRESAAGQSAHLPVQLGSLLAERGELTDALAAFDLAGTRFPLKEKRYDDFLRARRADLLHRLGRDTEAADAACGLTGRYWSNFSDRLSSEAASGVAGRTQLAVPFVRQHHMTCAPATLAAVSAFFGAPLDHLALARAITYDGTPDHEERHWLESHGWVVREFRVTLDAAVALLARGLPFTLVTTWTQAAHLQAVIGCDERLGTLIVRDPNEREAYETLGAELLEQQAPFGPRGMVFVPAGDAARLDGLELPEAAGYDEWYRLRRALVAHDRTTAAAAAERLQARAPDDRFACWARRQLAYYDDNPAHTLAAVAALRVKFPQETNLQLEELSLLSRLGRRAEHRERVSAIMAAGKADPAIWREQIELWRADAREHRRAARLARRFARARPYDWMARWTLAHVRWDARDFEAGVKLYRLAAAAGDKTEAAWQSYFAAARHTGRAAEALALLQARQRRLGAAAARPSLTLARALEQLDRTPEARACLLAAHAERPEDGELLLELALLVGRNGETEIAAQHLAAARDQTTPAVWHRTAARLAAWRADHAGALRHHEAVLAENPLDRDALVESAQLRARTAGPDAARAWLDENIARHPHFLPLRQMQLQRLRDRPVAEALAQVEAFLALEPNHAWALREQALIRLRAGRAADALASARLAEEIEPGVPHSAGVVGQVLLAQRDFAGARAATERALRLEIAAGWLMDQLLAACPEFGDRRAAVEFLRGELARQSAAATGFLRFREAATGVLPPDELWTALEALRGAQAECWVPWSACIQQAIALGRADSARALARQAVAQYPLVPRAWLDLADAHRLAGDLPAEQEALGRARELSPGWRDAALRLASLFRRQLQAGEAIRVLQATLAHDPLDAVLRGRLADALWHAGRQEEALAAVEQAAEAAPGWDEPWQRLSDWSRERREPARVITVVRRVVANRAGDPAARRQLVRVLNDRDELAAALEEANVAVALAPLDGESHELRAFVLARLGRRDEALAACRPPELADALPTALAGRAAWTHWNFGERKAAVDAMRAVVGAHPDYAWGWQQLAEWHNAMGETNRASEAALKYADLRPNEPVAWGWVASFKIKAREFDAAVPLLERALRLDPGYDYAAFHLLRLGCETSRWEQAERALALIREHASRWHALRCEAMLHRWRHDQAAALRVLGELCRAPAHETAALTAAAEEVNLNFWKVPVEAAVRAELPKPDCNAEAGAIWMRLRLERNTLVRPRVRWLERSGASEAVRRAAWRVYLEWLAKHKDTGVLRWHLWRRGRWLAAGDDTWGTVGYVLTNLGWHRRLAQWMADWRTREGIQPWMLSNLSHALLALDRPAELAEVVAAALRLPADQTRPKFVAWAARSAALAGRPAEAAQWLASFENHQNNAFAALAAAQARAVVGVAMAAPADRRGRLTEARQALAQAKAEHAGVAAIGYMARDHRRVQHAAARLAGNWWRWWYAVPLPTVNLPGSALGVVGWIVVGVVLVAAAASGAPAAIGLMVFFAVSAMRAAERQRR